LGERISSGKKRGKFSKEQGEMSGGEYHQAARKPSSILQDRGTEAKDMGKGGRKK